MDRDQRGVLRPTALAGVLVAALGIAAVVGFVVADDTPTGEEVLTNVEERYESADSVVVDATVRTEHNDTVTQFTVSTVSTDDGQMRANVSNGSSYVLLGHAGNATWITDSETNATLVKRNGTLVGQTPGIAGPNASGFVAGTNRSEYLSAANHSGALAVTNGSGGPMAQAHGWSRGHPPRDRANASVSTLLEETNLTAEFVETTTLDGQEVHVVEVTHPERDGTLTLWATTDTATVVKYRTTAPHATTTVTVTETHFDVAPAESTFQPPTPDASRGTSVDSLEDLQASTTEPIAVPGDEWSFERGTVLDGPAPAIASRYTANGSNVSVLQSNSSALSGLADEGRTVDVGDRTVTVTEAAGDRVVARWSEAGRNVVVVGDGSESELLDVLAGIEFTRE